MSEATLAKAMEPFFTTKGIGKGTGLGLSMVHGLTAQSGGAMQITSQLGKGTTVSLWLPRARREDVRQAAEQPPAVSAEKAGERDPAGRRRFPGQHEYGLHALAELLQVRGLQKLIDAFGDSLIDAVNPVTGRLHTSFLIAGASTGRFSARSPNLQQMPKLRQKRFRRRFPPPRGNW